MRKKNLDGKSHNENHPTAPGLGTIHEPKIPGITKVAIQSIRAENPTPPTTIQTVRRITQKQARPHRTTNSDTKLIEEHAAHLREPYILRGRITPSCNCRIAVCSTHPCQNLIDKRWECYFSRLPIQSRKLHFVCGGCDDWS